MPLQNGQSPSSIESFSESVSSRRSFSTSGSAIVSLSRAICGGWLPVAPPYDFLTPTARRQHVAPLAQGARRVTARAARRRDPAQGDLRDGGARVRDPVLSWFRGRATAGWAGGRAAPASLRSRGALVIHARASAGTDALPVDCDRAHTVIDVRTARVDSALFTTDARRRER